MWWWHGNSNWGAWLVMTASMAIFWGVVLWAFLSIVRNGPSAPGASEDAEAILGRRFTAGEIDEAEYEQRLTALRAARSGRLEKKAARR